MTYWLAWRNGECAYLVADSAVTVTGLRGPLPAERSSFGELHVRDDKAGRSVFQHALKLSESHDTVYTFSGNAALGKAIGRGLQRRMSHGVPYAEALRQAVVSGGPPATGESVHAGLIYHDGTHARVLEAKTSPSAMVREVTTMADGGSLPGPLKELTRELPAALARGKLKAAQELLSGVAILQTLAVHQYLMEYGVGGVWFGLGVGPKGIVRCPSCSYLLTNGQPTVERDHIIAVYPGEHNSMVRVGASTVRRLFVDPIWLSQQEGQSFRVRIDRWSHDASATLKAKNVAIVRTDCARSRFMRKGRNSMVRTGRLAFVGTLPAAGSIWTLRRRK